MVTVTAKQQVRRRSSRAGVCLPTGMLSPIMLSGAKQSVVLLPQPHICNVLAGTATMSVKYLNRRVWLIKFKQTG